MKSEENSGYGLIYQNVMRDKNLSIEAKAIYAYLCSYAGSKDECYPSRKLILNDLSICGETLDKHIKQLISYKYIEKIQIREKGKFAKNIYKINHLNIKPYTEESVTEKSTTNNNSLNNNSLKNNSIKNTHIIPQGGNDANKVGESLTVEMSQDDSHSKTRKARERKSTGVLSEKQQELFEQFWRVYPKKKSSGQAEKTFSKICVDDRVFEEIMAGLERAKKYDSRFTGDKGFIPYPSTWLNAKGWLDCFDMEQSSENNIQKMRKDDRNGENFEQQNTKPDPYEAIRSVELW